MTPQVLVLAGGEGKRFWPLTEPKPLIKFLGKSLFEHNLNNLYSIGFKNILVVTSPENNQEVKNKFPKITTVVQEKPLGMADGVLTAASRLTSDPLLIVSGTDLVDQSLYQALKTKIGKNFLVAKKVNSYFPGGYLKMSGSQVTKIVEKPGVGNEPSDLVKLVFDGFQNPQAFIKLLKTTSSDQDDVYEKAFSELLQQFEVIEYEGFWQATKYPWHILPAMRYFLDQIDSKDRIIIEPGVKIFEGAIIKGPAYIGKNTIIGNGALVRQSHIGENCVIGYNTEVARSYIGDNCWFHSNYIGDSVLENDVSFGAGTILANLRLDEAEIDGTDTNKLGAIIGSHVRIGVNTSLMPGVKIGGGSFIGAGLTVAQDIPDNSFVKAKVDINISPNKIQLNPESREKFKSNL